MPFSVINNLRTPSSKLQINFGVLQIGTENSPTGIIIYQVPIFSLSLAMVIQFVEIKNIADKIIKIECETEDK